MAASSCPLACPMLLATGDVAFAPMRQMYPLDAVIFTGATSSLSVAVDCIVLGQRRAVRSALVCCMSMALSSHALVNEVACAAPRIISHAPRMPTRTIACRQQLAVLATRGGTFLRVAGSASMNFEALLLVLEAVSCGAPVVLCVTGTICNAREHSCGRIAPNW